MAEPRTLILDAACAIVATEGLRALTLERVAKEAGVSVEQVGRDFTDPTHLAQEAFDYGGHKAMISIGERVKAKTTYDRLTGLLTLYIDNADVIVRQDWIFWVEMEAVALFDDSFDRIMSERSEAWNEMLSGLIQICISDGSVPATIDPKIASMRLMLYQDALGRQCILDMLPVDDARSEMVVAIQRELQHG